MTELSRTRLRAPDLVGRGGWLNTGGRQLTLADLRGKVVILDFWTFCCINCLHVLDELRELEARFADVLVVVGVHSPKFAHETEHDAVVAAVERYDVHHPVLDDPEMTTWKAYAARAWPTLTVLDPEGYIVAQASGEGHGPGLVSLIDELVAVHEAKGTLHRGDGPYVAPEPPASPLRFPGKVVALPSGGFLVSDTLHHSIVELVDDVVVRRIGDGSRGATASSFSEPQGLCLLPAEVAAEVGYDVVVADTVNHLLRGIVLATGEVRTVAGTGTQMRVARPGPALEADLSSPWDVVWWQGRVAVAMAGVHQLWWFDPVGRTVGVLAGTQTEGLRDGDALEAWMAQPSGLAADGDTLWIADSETSALRRLRDGKLETLVGQGLFDFGHVDGPAAEARLQHPLGVAVLPDGSVAVCDTYNHAVRRYDPVTESVSTLCTGLAEPSGAVVVDGVLWVVESAAHRVVAPLTPGQTAELVRGEARQTQRPRTDLAPGPVRLEVVFEPPSGQKLDERYGPSTRLVVSASPPELLLRGDGADSAFGRDLVLSGDVAEGVLHVTATAASCDDDPAVEFPACHVSTQDWGIPVRVVPGAPSRLGLVLRGMDA